MGKKFMFFYTVIALSVFMLFTGKTSNVYAAEDPTITKGVFIDEVDVSGMTAKEAEEAIDKYFNELKKKQLTVMVDNSRVTTTLDELGYSYKINGVIEEALKIGTSGNLIKRYKEMKDIAHGGIKYPLEYSLDENKVREFVSVKVSEYNVEPVNASVYRNEGKLIYTNHVPGKQVNVEPTVLNILDKIKNSWDRNDITIEAYIQNIDPIYTRDIVEKCNTILGSFTTEYANSAEGRAANLANGAKLINNTVLYPGDIFSGYEHLAPFTEENGYFSAGAYSAGKVIDSIGGGACQVTTTLYNAVLEAELEIVERHAHSMTISYVDLSRDAAIAGTYKDLKFKNNTDVPILIEAYTKGRKITFNIWGCETRDTTNRKIKFETKVLSKTAPPADVIEKDPTKPETYKKITQSAHTGYRTELYKVVYENGVEVDRILINKSYYSPAPRYITIGTKKVEVAPPKDKTDKNKDTSKEDKDKKPDKKDDSQKEEEKTQDNIENTQTQFEENINWNPEWDEEGFEDE